MFKTDHAKAFGTDEIAHDYNSVILASNGFGKLGYIVESPFTSDGDMRSTILNYLNGSTSYGFYIDCHGSPHDLTDNKTWTINTYDISGNFHLVFLDACETAANTDWANAFNCNRPSRTFLGWKYTVGADAAYEFSQHFWPNVGSKSLYNVALDAAAASSGKTPIILIGDKSWYGKAY
ncbi:hypothetical protein [Clostridium folliculivorans]|uniref:hypothetical protein n=1 Tax=Clostridium folliculivorans TaxID=2886038 RepID=UPI0021C3B2A6|nr:hypothetical protein [Clostridium folliculivorans]GKU30161.1 hypothetical protein CFB3_22680 [Clostridium folliculivorans]